MQTTWEKAARQKENPGRRSAKYFSSRVVSWQFAFARFQIRRRSESTETLPRNRTVHWQKSLRRQGRGRKSPGQFQSGAKWPQSWLERCRERAAARNRAGQDCQKLPHCETRSSEQFRKAARGTWRRFPLWFDIAHQFLSPATAWTLRVSECGFPAPQKLLLRRPSQRLRQMLKKLGSDAAASVAGAELPVATVIGARSLRVSCNS